MLGDGPLVFRDRSRDLDIEVLAVDGGVADARSVSFIPAGPSLSELAPAWAKAGRLALHQIRSHYREDTSDAVSGSVAAAAKCWVE